MELEKVEEFIEKLRECEDVALSRFRSEREKINGKQEGYQEAMFAARTIIREFIEKEN